MILKAFKFRLYPDNDQEIILNKTFGCVRFVWNKMTENFNSWDPIQNPYPEPINEKILKEYSDYEWLKEVSAASLQQKRIDFEETKKQFFNKKRKRKLGRPNFKNKRSKQSFRLPSQKFELNQINSFIKLEKIGKVKIILDREIPNNVNYRSTTVSKDPTGKFYASILVQINIDPKPLTGKKVGIDLGLKDLFILDNGGKINNPKWFSDNQTKLKKEQQSLERKQKGSNRRNKQRIKVAKVHEKIRFRRNHFLHEISSSLVTEYDIICIEDLNVSGMIKNHNLAKAIADVSWSSFVSMLNYKCDWYGKTLVRIDRWYPSSKTCSSCGYKMSELPLNIREWNCPKCNTFHNRDVNAAKNILQKGISDLTGEEVEFFGVSKKPDSAECVEYKHREDISLRRRSQPQRSVE
jgi:putative transposase